MDMKSSKNSFHTFTHTLALFYTKQTLNKRLFWMFSAEQMLMRIQSCSSATIEIDKENIKLCNLKSKI